MTMDGAEALLRACSYPATCAEIAETHGDYELDLPNGSERLDRVLARCGARTTFDCPEEAVDTLYAGVSSKAVGRVGYSDRDPTPMGVDGADPVSF